jgi:hypothetical protein
MKYSRAFAATVALTVCFNVGQSQAALVAGWDFSQFAASGANSTDGATFTGAISANYSDSYTPSPDAAAAAQGTLFYDGTNGSTLTDFTTFGTPTVGPTSGGLGSVQVQTADANPFSDSSSYGLLLSSGQAFAANYTLRSTGDVSLVFSATAAAASTDWAITFAALDTDGATIGWEYSTDGSSFSAAAAGSTIVGTADTGYTASFAELDGQSTVYIRANLSNVAGGTLQLDNVGITAVPEPATYALFLGTIALGFIMRRRFQGK